MQLLDVALQEAKQRGKSPLRAGDDSMQSSRPTEEVRKDHRSTEKASKQVDPAAVTLSPGKLNAVRAAFKAGVTPVRIARQFGISRMNVRKALASDDRS
jgi:DNA invertase Pin-like site-specific DNA recombinase